MEFLGNLAPLVESALRKVQVEGQRVVKMKDEDCESQYPTKRTGSDKKAQLLERRKP